MFVVVLLPLLAALNSCQRPPFSDKINGKWTGSTIDKHHGIRFSVKEGKIDEASFSLNFEPEKTGAMALLKCGYSVSFRPGSPVSGREFSVEGEARGMRFGLAGQKSDQGTTAVKLRGTFTADDAGEGELTVTLDNVPDCARFNGTHLFHWSVSRDGSPRQNIKESPAVPPVPEPPKS